MTLRNLLVRVGADISGLKKGLNSAQKDVKYFGRNVTGSLKEMQKNIATTATVIGGGFLLKSGVQDAMRFEALMTTIGETMGESRKEFEKWQSQVGTSLGFSRLQSAELANMLSLNFRKIATDQEDLMNKTTKMMELSAVISNKRGMTITEVSDRIRSAMNQEADGAMELGVDVRIAAIKAGKAYQEMANGQPWDKLSEHMRKTILYHHIFEQVSENLGMTMQDTTGMRMAGFMATLADLRMSLGQAFLPILHTVLPILTQLAQALYRAMQFITAFTRSLFGGFKYKAPVDQKAIEEGTKAIGGMGAEAEKAGKKSVKSAKATKKAWTGLFGFDEVNTIADPAESAGAGGGGGGGAGGGVGDLGGMGEELPMPQGNPFTEAVDELMQSMNKYTKPIKEAFRVVWDFVSNYLKEKIGDMKKWWAENGATVKKAGQNVWNFIVPVFKAVGKFVLDSILMLVEGVVQAFGGIVKFLSGVFTGDWKKAWEGIKDFFWGAVKALFGFFNLTFIGGIRKALAGFILKGIKSLKTFVDDFKKAFAGGLSTVRTYWNNLLSRVKTVANDIKNWVNGRVELMKTSFKTLWTKAETWAKTAWTGIKNVFKGVASWFARTVINPVVDKISEIRDAFSKGIGTGFKTIMNQIIKGINSGIKAINDVKNGMPFGSKIKDIPTLNTIKLAQGGITNGPTLAMVGDNPGGREVVSPLDRLQSMLTNSVIQAMQMGGGGNQQSSGDIVLNIDGRAFARVVKPFMEREENRRGQDVRIRTL